MSDNQSIDFVGEVGKLRVLMEQVLHEAQAANEGVVDIQRKIAYLPMQDNFEGLKQDMKTIKAAVIDTNRDLAVHKHLSANEAHGPEHVSRPGWAAA